MKRLNVVLACVVSCFLLTSAKAAESPEYLIQSCKEVVGIYAQRDQKRLAAGLTTSVSEALRAGYCMGVVEEYRRHKSCYTRDWFTQATRISEQPLPLTSRIRVSELLEMSCGY
ncbi:hypothetical protein ACKC9G_05565 [Pokkaliibacter sp. CJK22405]|uniref:hypothetical protein n=1 Tax=Pokkaliibacter sp. CJK22405 TaxID=3384615 RepID=UPI0039851A8A